MKILEHFIRSKQGSDLTSCEDAWVATSDFVAVIDGATSTGTRRWTATQYTSGQWASRVLVQAIHSLSDKQQQQHHQAQTNHSYQTATDIISYLTDSLAAAYREEGVYDWMQSHPTERATASLILYSRRLNQIIAVGDCQAALLNAHDGIMQHLQHEKYNDQVMAAARAMYWNIQLLQGDKAASDDDDDTDNPQIQTTQDCGRDYIQPLRLGQRLFQNNPLAPAPWQYWVLDGFAIDAKAGIHVYDVPPAVHQIILATDGYLTLRPTLDETEQVLQATLQRDSRLIQAAAMGTKGRSANAESFDDRTFVRFATT